MPKILIIEESQRLCDILATFLKKKGMDFTIAQDGISGARALVGGPHDCLLINRDLHAMSGEDIVRKLRATPRGRSFPVIMMSGSHLDTDQVERLTQELSLSGFLVMPFTSIQLSAALADALQPRPQERQAAAPEAVPEAAPPQPAASPPGHQALSADLETTPFEQVLSFLIRKGGTGILTVSRDAVTRTFYFIGGALAAADVSAEDRDFGEHLERAGLATPEERKHYREQRLKAEGDPRDVFVKMGCLTPRRFQEENDAFSRECLIECFSWNTGTARFERGSSIVPSLPAESAFMPSLLYRGLKAHLAPDRLTAFLEDKGGLYPVRTAAFYDYRSYLATEAGTEPFDLIDGSRTCAEIGSAGGVNETTVLLYALDYLGALTFSETPAETVTAPPFPIRAVEKKQAVPEANLLDEVGAELSALVESVTTQDIPIPPPAAAAAPEPAADGAGLEDDLRKQWDAIKDKNYYEMFGMKQGEFSFDKLKKAYFELTKKFGPEKFFASSGEVMALAEELLSKISNAYETLTNVVSKESYDELLASQEEVPAGTEDKVFYEQIQFQSGKVFVQQGQYASAEKAFSNCLNIDPEKPEYLAYLALAIYNNPANRSDAGAIRRAKEAVNKSLQRGKISIAHALKGTMYLDEGNTNFAEAEFNRALKLNPNNKTALKQLEFINAKREEEKKGLFQRMFK